MSMSASGRGTAIYNQIAASANFDKLSDPEKLALKNQLIDIFGADLSYITSNATVNPGTFKAAAGATVATTGTATAQTGTVTSASPSVTGTGTIS